MFNIAFCSEYLPPLTVVIIIAILVIFFTIFVNLNTTSIVNSKSYWLHHFNTILPLQEAAGLQSKDRIMIVTLEYQILGKTMNNVLSYDYTHIPQLDSNPINTSEYSQGSIRLKPWISKAIMLDNFSTYTNYDYGFTLHYPSNWNYEGINRFTSDHDLLVAKLFPDATTKNLVNVSILVDKSGINQNLNGYINERIDKYKKSSAFDSISTSIERSHLAAHPAYKLSLSESGPENRRLNSIEIGTVVGGEGFIIRSTVNDNQYSLYQKDIELIVNSFRLLGNPL